MSGFLSQNYLGLFVHVNKFVNQNSNTEPYLILSLLDCLQKSKLLYQRLKEENRLLKFIRNEYMSAEDEEDSVIQDKKVLYI